MFHNLCSRLHILLTVLSCFRCCEIFVFYCEAGVVKIPLLPDYWFSALGLLNLSPVDILAEIVLCWEGLSRRMGEFLAAALASTQTPIMTIHVSRQCPVSRRGWNFPSLRNTAVHFGFQPCIMLGKWSLETRRGLGNKDKSGKNDISVPFTRWPWWADLEDHLP